MKYSSRSFIFLFLLSIIFSLFNSCGKNNSLSQGCTNPSAINYDSSADLDDGSCIFSGCTDSTALNYNPVATIDDSSCVYEISGCTDSTALNYNPLANIDDSSCIFPIYGCTDFLAINYSINANVDDGSCIYSGCTDSLALNFSSISSLDDGSCVYCSDVAEGIWDINPSCPNFTLPITGDEINLNDRFDDSIVVICNAPTQVQINFGSSQIVYSYLDEFGILDVPSQTFSVDFTSEGFGFIDVNITGSGQIDSPITGTINLTYSFVLPFSSDSSFISCPLYLTR